MPSGWLLLLIGMMGCPAQAESIYDHEIKNYEIITPLVKTSLKGRNRTTELKVQFLAFNRSFCLLLQEDEEFQDLEVASLEAHGSSYSVRVNSSFFEGTVNGSISDSTVSGYLCDKVFCGTVSEDDLVYFIESAEFFFTNSSYSGKAVIYRREDVEGKHAFDDTHKRRKPYLVNNLLFPSRFRLFPYLGPDLPKGIDRSGQPNADYACRVEMVADHTLYQHFNKDMDVISAFLYLHTKFADSVFRKSDFDGDGFKDNIRIIVKKIFVYKSANDANYPMSRAADLMEFLKLFTKRTQNYCLSVCICYRRYSSLAIGRAYKPTSGIRSTPGGICQKVVKLKSDEMTYVPTSLNTAVVTVRNSRGQTLPLITTLLAVTHEIGHAFGSDHDPIDNLFCSPGGTKGYYLMHPTTTRELRELSSVFSPCSRREIDRIIKDRGECLRIYASTCGNGVREGDEECDCGWEKICKTLDPCCTPADAKPPDKPCTFRRSAGAHCSPKESPCCSDNCSVRTRKDTVCYSTDVACLISHCDGNSSSCPDPKQAPDGYPCKSTSKTCFRGACNSSVCLDNGLKACTCQEKSLSCFVCCEKNGFCRPAHTIGLKNRWVNIFVALAGSYCNGSGNFRCDGTGNCVDVKARIIGDKSKDGVLWWTLAILVTVFVTLIVIFIYLLKSYCGPSILQVSTSNLTL